MSAKVIVKDGGVHIITGPNDMCECGIDNFGRARSCRDILQEAVQRASVLKPSVRCKVICTDVKPEADVAGRIYREVISFSAVYSDNPNSENKWFSQWTPWLTFTKAIDNPNAFGAYVKGEEYYVDFTHCPKPPTNQAELELTTDTVPSPSDATAPAEVVAGAVPVPVIIVAASDPVVVSGEGSAPAEVQALAPEAAPSPTEPMPPQAS